MSGSKNVLESWVRFPGAATKATHPKLDGLRLPLVLDLRIAHDRFGSSSDPSLNGHLHYLNDIDKSLNEDATDKILKYHPDCNNNPPNVVSFIPDITSRYGRLHSGFISLLFLQVHRETDRFFTDSGVQLV